MEENQLTNNQKIKPKGTDSPKSPHAELGTGLLDREEK